MVAYGRIHFPPAASSTQSAGPVVFPAGEWPILSSHRRPDLAHDLNCHLVASTCRHRLTLKLPVCPKPWLNLPTIPRPPKTGVVVLTFREALLEQGAGGRILACPEAMERDAWRWKGGRLL